MAVSIGFSIGFGNSRSLATVSTVSSMVYHARDYVRGGSERALASPEFGGSEKRTERETDNLLLIAPPESKS